VAIAFDPEFYQRNNGFAESDDQPLWTPQGDPEIGGDLWTPDAGVRSITPEIIMPGQPLSQAEQMVQAYDDYVLEMVYGTADFEPQGKKYRDTEFGQLLPPPGELINLDKLPELMGRLAVKAHTADLAHLRYGLFAYMLVTEACIAVLPDAPKGHRQFPGLGVKFDDPEKIGRTMPVFFDELVKALDHHVEGRPDAIKGWSKKFYSPEAQQALPAQAMLDFLSVHVRYDLPVALVRTNTLDKHRDDYTEKVNQILTHVAMQIMPLYAKAALPSYPAAAVEKFGLRLALNELFGARNEAWVAFKHMERINDLQEFADLRSWQQQRTEGQLVTGRRVASLVLSKVLKKEPHKWPIDQLPNLPQIAKS